MSLKSAFHIFLFLTALPGLPKPVAAEVRVCLSQSFAIWYPPVAHSVAHPGRLGSALFAVRPFAVTLFAVWRARVAEADGALGSNQNAVCGAEITIASNTETLYRKLCAGCHGASGQPEQSIAALFDPPPKAFAEGRSLRQATEGEDPIARRKRWISIIRYGSGGMPGFLPRLTDGQIQELTVYLERLELDS